MNIPQSGVALKGPSRILVVDDDPGMRRVISGYLAEHGMIVDVAASAAEMVLAMKTASHRLVVLDLKLGDADGLDVLRELRALSDLPVIIVTGHRSDEIDKVVGLELGADDYVTKPFSLRELLARVRVVLRRLDSVETALQSRAAKTGRQAEDARTGLLRFGGWILDRRTRTLQNPGGAEVALTNGELTLLIAFLEAPQRPLSREHLLQATRVHEDIFDRSIDVQILRLRRKLDIDPAQPSMIRTERGVGYVFTLAVER